ncbi:TRAP transporter substrate-binding protein [Halomonas sp. MCCC 1A11036]|uniref:TRAP transporter substrate-binding protein n=1 Tax=Billgrantia zhangzhouensis TaxID=2733481 RepID=A0ABS9ABR9_9GAMM|nr:TRAP transporter substrate-binding protein [Halomonas zhangzhouensis]MCE8018589.1 TRAP transporter substrate-binding protein [Halomonas zhangzhouensis]
MRKTLMAVSALTMIFSAQIQAQDVRNMTLRFASTSPQGTPQYEGMSVFKDLVETRSEGNIKIQLFPNGVLGGDSQVLSSLQGGIIDMMVWNAGNLSNIVPDFAIFDFPFIFDDAEEVDEIVDGDTGSLLLSKLENHQLVGLAYWEQGFRYLTNRSRPIEDLEDLRGLNIRVQETPLFMDMWSALGANPVPMAFTELYTAMETGAVDGQENPAPLIMAAKFNEVQEYLTVTRHNYNPQVVLIGKPTWNKLNESERDLIQQAAFDARIEQREVSRQADEEALNALASMGMSVNYLDEEQVLEFRQAVEPVIEKYSARIDNIVLNNFLIR